MSYQSWFKEVTGFKPLDWQAELAKGAQCRDHLIRIPTGFGKTAGIALAWAYHRVLMESREWPTRLCLVLPMRVLVEQSERALQGWMQAVPGAPQVHVLMGGVEAGEWALSPEKPAILVGTQDMLLSRALNRGYAAARGRWPVDFGLLHHDTLWVMDEVQLMDVGLMTSAQLGAFRRSAEGEHGALRPAATWWMSATLQPRWLESVDTREQLPELESHATRIDASARKGGLWEVEKSLEHLPGAAAPGELGQAVMERHEPGGLTLVVVNRVRRAEEVMEAIAKLYSEGSGKKRRLRDDAPDLRLVHSRFRGAERRAWAEDFLRRDAVIPEPGRIIVATQVVEAGVDISAKTLVTDLAPWSSLVQRFGRAARYAGETAQVVVVGGAPKDDRAALPYRMDELGAALEAVGGCVEAGTGVSPKAVEALEEEWAERAPELLQRLYPYAPGSVLRREEMEDLFDTAPDLSGVDLDISRFIRSGDERDVSLFWRPLEFSSKEYSNGIARKTVGAVYREELCPAPLNEVRKWLARERNVFVLDYVQGKWLRRPSNSLCPGMQVLLPCELGGYLPERGFSPPSKKAVEPSTPSAKLAPSDFDASAGSEEDESLSAVEAWQTVAFHGYEVAREVRRIAERLGLDQGHARLLELAARWHDAGKVHQVFQAGIEKRPESPPLATRRDLAKAPDGAWRRPDPYPGRAGFRHELVSALALFELLRRSSPEHSALCAPYAELLEALGTPALPLEEEARISKHPLALELSALSARDLDLVAFLVCAHHGKVRCSLAATPKDLDAAEPRIHGVIDGEKVGPFELMDARGERHEVPELELGLEELAMLGIGPRYGRSWTERVLALREHLGPFQLAYLEAILRAADWRASRAAVKEEL